MATKTRSKGAVENIVESAADAAEEIGRAAVAFKKSWEHVRHAQAKAAPATRVAKRATKAVARTAKKATRKVMGKAKRRSKSAKRKSR
jgi:hypothetical protein